MSNSKLYPPTMIKVTFNPISQRVLKIHIESSNKEQPYVENYMPLCPEPKFQLTKLLEATPSLCSSWFHAVAILQNVEVHAPLFEKISTIYKKLDSGLYLNKLEFKLDPKLTPSWINEMGGIAFVVFEKTFDKWNIFNIPFLMKNVKKINDSCQTLLSSIQIENVNPELFVFNENVNINYDTLQVTIGEVIPQLNIDTMGNNQNLPQIGVVGESMVIELVGTHLCNCGMNVVPLTIGYITGPLSLITILVPFGYYDVLKEWNFFREYYPYIKILILIKRYENVKYTNDEIRGYNYNLQNYLGLDRLDSFHFYSEEDALQYINSKLV